jgi:hypothetical protein
VHTRHIQRLVGVRNHVAEACRSHQPASPGWFDHVGVLQPTEAIGVALRRTGATRHARGDRQVDDDLRRRSQLITPAEPSIRQRSPNENSLAMTTGKDCPPGRVPGAPRRVWSGDGESAAPARHRSAAVAVGAMPDAAARRRRGPNHWPDRV